MSYCKVCMSPYSKYVMNNKKVCLKCDDLLFDVEIEEEEFESGEERRSPAREQDRSQPVKRTKVTK